MEKLSVNRSFRYGISRQGSSEFERCLSRDYGYQAIVLKYNRPTNIRNVSARIISRSKKNNSFLSTSDSKENLNPKTGVPKILSERCLDKNIEKPISALQPAPSIFPVAVSRFESDLKKFEEKLLNYYSH